MRTLAFIACLIASCGIGLAGPWQGAAGAETRAVRSSAHPDRRAAAGSRTKRLANKKRSMRPGAKAKHSSRAKSSAKRTTGPRRSTKSASGPPKKGHKRNARPPPVRIHSRRAKIVRATAVAPKTKTTLSSGIWQQPGSGVSPLDDIDSFVLPHAGRLALSSASVLVVDKKQGKVLFEKNSTAHWPIASITKLMTAMVVLDAHQPMDQLVAITDADVDRLKHSRSRLPVGTRLTQGELLHLALLASENRAASALCRSYPGGMPACVAAMNEKARMLGMLSTHFDDPTGLFPTNTSTARDLGRMVRAAYTYPAIREITSSAEYVVDHLGRVDGVRFRNTNRLVRSDDWTIGLSKTGYIEEAGRCLVMEANVANRPTLFVLLHGQGRGSHFVDATRLRQWIERRILVTSNAP